METSDILIIICYLLSSLLEATLIIIYSIFPNKFLRHPNQFFYYSLFSQVLYSLLGSTIIILFAENLRNPSKYSQKVFKTLFLIFSFFFLVFFHYILILNLEIYRKLSNSLNKCTFKRLCVYHLLTFTLSSVIILLSVFISDEEAVGRSGYGIHSILIMYYMLVTSVFIWFCIINFIKKRLFSRFKGMIGLACVSLLISIYILSEYVQMIMHIEGFYEKSYKVITLIQACFGIMQFLAMAIDRNFWKTIKKAWKSKKINAADSFLSLENKELTMTIDAKDFEINQSVALFSDLLENITKTSLIKIFVSISLMYMDQKPSNSQKTKHLFEAEDLARLNSILKLDFIRNSKINIVNPRHLDLEEYFPDVFYSIRAACGYTDMMSSLIDPKNYEKIVNMKSEQGGRSNSFVFLTADEKLIIKTINKHELKVFISKVLKDYSERVLTVSGSRLSRIFGAFKLKALKLNFIVIENVLHRKDFSYVFDLKGSKVDREVKGIFDCKNPPTGTVLKDVNFLNLNYKLDIPEITKQSILNTLIQDFLMLKELGIMDYSVLLGICIACETTQKLNRYSFISTDGLVISIGIIDFFQEYNLGKVGEKAVKSMFNKQKDISSMNPTDYFLRITNFLTETFSLECENI